MLTWFQDNGRHSIPWKLTAEGTVPTPNECLPVYPIWVAEVMLQQTQLKVALPYWERWMLAFPSIDDLVVADESETLLVWQGLGYYSRVRRLHTSSKMLFSMIGPSRSTDSSRWPDDLNTWTSLPGIGRSTAGSIISSAFNLPTAILDANVKRILVRLIGTSIPPERNSARLWDCAVALLDPHRPRDFNQALMDLGSTVCTNHKPICIQCPLKDYCVAYSLNEPTKFPAKLSVFSVSKFVIGIGLILNESNEVLIDKRLDHVKMGGMWEFPGGKQEKGEAIETTISRELLEELGVVVNVEKQLIAFEHLYSHQKLNFIVHLCSLVSGVPKPLSSQEVRWVKIQELSKYPFPKANLRIIAALKTYLLL